MCSTKSDNLCEWKFISMLNWQGNIKIKALGKNNEVLEEWDINNTITSEGKNLLAECLRNSSLDAQIKYVALGNDNTTPTTSDATLGNEIFRKLVTSHVGAGTGVSKTTCYIAPDEAVAQIEEIGFFAGSTATATTDSGILYARILFSRNKTSLEALQIERTDTIA